MNRRIAIARAIELTLEVLSLDPKRIWDQRSLAMEVQSLMGLKVTGANHQTPLDAIYSLHGQNLIHGHVRGKNTLTTIYHKPADTSNDSEQVSQLRDDLAQCKKVAVEVANAAKVEIGRITVNAELAVKDASSNVVRIEVTKGKKVKITEGLFHTTFKRILGLANARKNIFLYGPTGCGKSHLCEQLADALGLDFYFVSCTAGMSEGTIGGRLLPTGKSGTFEYTISEFLKAYEGGGVFLLDEMDAADPNVLLFINAALANGRTAVPSRPDEPYAKRHPDFICIAAANTVGTGADRMYSGRNKLDAATLDRFQIGKVCMGYDERVEKVLCPNDTLRNRLLKYRKAIHAHRLERAMSTRFMIDAHDMTQDHGWTDADVDEALFTGWREDEVNKVKSYR